MKINSAAKLVCLCILSLMASHHLFAVSVIASGPPKSGNNMLVKCLEGIIKPPLKGINIEGRWSPFLTQKQIDNAVKHNAFLWGHLVFNEENIRLVSQNALKMVFIIRDPRDVIISWDTYLIKLIPKQEHKKRKYFLSQSQSWRLKKLIQRGMIDWFLLEKQGHCPPPEKLSQCRSYAEDERKS